VGLQVDHVREAPRHTVQPGLVDVNHRRWLGLDQGLPGIGRVELAHQAGPRLPEDLSDLRVEPPPGPVAHHGECGVRPVGGQEEGGVAGDLADPGR
jgi:hypothetical protein